MRLMPANRGVHRLGVSQVLVPEDFGAPSQPAYVQRLRLATGKRLINFEPYRKRSHRGQALVMHCPIG